MRSGVIIFFFVLLCIFLSCDKGDIKANRLQRGNGRWNMSTWEKIGYNADGTVQYDSVFHNIGEIIFFQDGSLNALYDYYSGVMKLNLLPVGQQVYRIEYYDDGNRFHIASDGVPVELQHYNINKLYTVVKNRRNKQELIYIKSDGNIPLGPALIK